MLIILNKEGGTTLNNDINYISIVINADYFSDVFHKIGNGFYEIFNEINNVDKRYFINSNIYLTGG